MTNQDKQIVTAYEVAQMEVAEIGEEFDIPIEAVKLCLLQNSRAYYSSVKESSSGDGVCEELVGVSNTNEPELFDAQDMNAARDAIRSLVYSEIDNVRLKASKFIIDEKKGRNDLKAVRDIGISVGILAERFKQARKAMERVSSPIINVEATSTSNKQLAA
jgi:hypothetical protein